MKTFSRLSSLILLSAAMMFGQNFPNTSITFDNGVFYSLNYNFGYGASGPLRVTTGAASGTSTLTLAFGYSVLPDGRKFYPFTNVSTFPPITLDTGSARETVTPSSSSCSTPEIINTCTITATFSNAHGVGVQIYSGDSGLQEAINDASNFGGGMVYWVIDPGIVTLSTSGANTSAGSVNIPTRSTVMGATARVTTTITGCSGGWSLGYSSGTEFGSANTTLTAGTTTDSSTLQPAVAFNASATVPIIHCTTANASAGAVHPRVWGYKMVAPAN